MADRKWKDLGMTCFSDIATDLQQTISRVRPLLERIADEEASRRPEPDKWSRKEILGHLLDSASNNHQRFVRAAIDRALAFPAYPQNELVALQRFNNMDWGALITFWASYNLFLSQVISVLPSDSATVQCIIGKNAPATLEFIAQDYVVHLKHHLKQILGSSSV